MCIARINIYGITSPASFLTRVCWNVSSKWVGVRIDTRLHLYQNVCCMYVGRFTFSFPPASSSFETSAWKKSSRNKRDGNETNSTSRGVYIKEWLRGRKRERRELPFVWILPRQIGCRIKLSDYFRRFIMFRSIVTQQMLTQAYKIWISRNRFIFSTFNRGIRFNFRL